MFSLSKKIFLYCAQRDMYKDAYYSIAYRKKGNNQKVPIEQPHGTGRSARCFVTT